MEIAELEGMDGENASLQVLFQWDPVTDTLKGTGVPSKYLQELIRYTGLSKDELENELIKRKNFLEDLSKRNIRSLRSVINAFNNYK